MHEISQKYFILYFLNKTFLEFFDSCESFKNVLLELKITLNFYLLLDLIIFFTIKFNKFKFKLLTFEFIDLFSFKFIKKICK